MSISSKYAALLGNLTQDAPLHLDPILFDKDPSQGDDIPFTETGAMVSSDLWSRNDDNVSFIGIRVTDPIEDRHAIAADLAATAVEREIVPIFLSWIGQCGMQRFGFRVELVGGTNKDEMRVCEEQLKRLWNLAIIVDAKDVCAFN